jgi:MarR family transcriptional regulator, transcriptional regulator for hemolysin
MAAKPRDQAGGRERGETEDATWSIRLGFAIHDTSRLRKAVYDTAFKQVGITRSQGWVLGYLSRKDGMTQSELAAQLDLGKVALGGLVDRLELSGLVERRSDAGDRRMKRVFLTHDGSQVVRKMRVIATRVNEEIVSGIDPKRIQETAETLRLVKQNLLEMANGRSPLR